MSPMKRPPAAAATMLGDGFSREDSMKKAKPAVLAILFFSFFAGRLAAQDVRVRIGSISLKDFPQIRIVLSVENSLGAPVPLDTGRLRLYEQDRLMERVSVVPQDSRAAPIFAAIVLDKSGSMKGEAIDKAKKGAVEFVRNMREGDQAAYIAFDTNVDVISEFTPNAAALIDSILKTAVGSDTALLEAVYRAADMHAATPQAAVKAVLALTDGLENRSRKTIDEVIARARELSVSIYTIGLGRQVDSAMLSRLARETEANYYPAPEPKDLIAIYQRISKLLHSQLLVEYKTPFAMDDRWHALRVVIPYMGREISGSREYLSAKESKIPTELLLGLTRERRQLEGMAGLEETLRRQEEMREKRQKKLLVILAASAVILLLVLLYVVSKRKA